MKRHGNLPSPCLLIHISDGSSAVCPGSGKKEIPLQPSGKNTDFISEAAPENQAFKAVMSSVHVSGRSLHPDKQRPIHDSSGLFSFPHMQSGSSTGDFPRPMRLYSAFDWTCGYPVRMIGWPASDPFRLVLSILSEPLFQSCFRSLDCNTGGSIRQYKLTILCFPELRDRAQGKPVSSKPASST